MEPLRPDDRRQVGPYRLEYRLGGGGMGRVYLGRSPGGRPVAVKVVKSELADYAEFRRRFAVEVEAARKVGGFHTAQVVDADPDGDPPWLVTAYIPGPSLRQQVDANGPLPTESIVTLATGLAEGLAAVHAAGLVHRDLKPENVLLAADGPRLIDFGIARAMDGTSLTASGQAVGTYAYMSPERFSSDGVDQASDVFSLGAVLVYAATGRAPFGSGPLERVMYRILHDAPDLGDVPVTLADLVAACLAKNPADRPNPSRIIEQLGTFAETGSQWPPADVTRMITTLAGEAGTPTARAKDTKQSTVEPIPSPPASARAVQQRGNLAIGNLSREELDVLVDDGVVGTVHAGGQNIFAVASGAHTVLTRVGRQRSSLPQPVEIQPGATVRLGYKVPHQGANPETAETVMFTQIPARSITMSCLFFVPLFALAVTLVAVRPTGFSAIPEEAVAFVATLIIGGFGIRVALGSRAHLAVSNDGVRFDAKTKKGEKTIRWGAIDRVSVVGDGRDAELVIWPPARSIGPETITYDVGKKLTPMHSAAEIRGALRWFGGDLYTEQPG